MDDTTLAIIAVFLIGFTLLVLGLQISRGDDEQEETRDGEDDDAPGEPNHHRPRLSEMSPGEAPSTALPVNGREALERAAASVRCEPCGRCLEGVEPRWSEMVFAGRLLASARWSCPGCGAERTVYFEVRTPEKLAG